MYLCSFIQWNNKRFCAAHFSSWKLFVEWAQRVCSSWKMFRMYTLPAQREDEGNITQSLSKYIFMCINYHAELMLLSNYLRCASMYASSHNVNHLMLCSPTSLKFDFSRASSVDGWKCKMVKCKMTADAVKWKYPRHLQPFIVIRKKREGKF